MGIIAGVNSVCNASVGADAMRRPMPIKCSISKEPQGKKLPQAHASGLSISANFDSGNIKTVAMPPLGSADDNSSPQEIVLEISPDPYCEADGREHYQWYHFRASGVRSKACVFKVRNAGGASYGEAWKGYNSTASYDRHFWFRVPTDYDEASGELSINHTPDQDVCYYAFFAPYSLEQHADLVSWAVTRGATVTEVCKTVDGYPLDVVAAGTGPKPVWIIARQHPGESMAEWYMEGLMKRLLNSDDPLSRSLLKKCTFYLVPNMNPDGSRRGYLRTNAAGRNLNREWETPSEEHSPEVFHILKAMEATGVKFFLDVHGDEDLPYNFIAGNEGIPSWDKRLEDLQEKFKACYMNHSPDFQVTHGYPADGPGEANLAIASNAVGEKFKCVAMTLEQPFKDTADDPQHEQGWSPERSMVFGASVLNAIADVEADL